VTTANFSTAGVYVLRLTGSDSVLSNFDNVTIIVGTPLAVTCSPFPTTALLKETVTWSANVSGGTSPFTYTWSGSPPISTAPVGPTSATTDSQPVVYSTVGRKIAIVTVTDSASPPAQKECEADIRINLDPTLEEF
jgi:hypothetical protein